MNRICSPMLSTSNDRSPAGSHGQKNRSHELVGARGEKSTWTLVNQVVPIKALVLAMFYGVSGTTAMAESYTLTEWTQPNPIPSSGPVTVLGTLGNATVTFVTQKYHNAGAVYATDWSTFLPAGSTITNQQSSGGSFSSGSLQGSAITQTFTFSQAVLNPVLMFNYVDNATYDFSGLTLASAPTAVAGTGPNYAVYDSATKVLTISGANNLGTTGFRVQLSGRYTTGSFAITLTNSSLQNQNYDSFGIGFAVLTSLLPLVNAADTMASIQAMGADLNKVYNAQYGVAQLGLTYDCKLFDKNDLCLSTGARVTHSRNDGSTYDGVALIAAYRAKPDLRVGAWIDQNESRKMASNVTAGNRTPMFGAFAVWNENPTTAEGLELKLSAAYGQKDLSLTRPVVGTSERGQGNAKLSTFVAEASVGYGIALDARTSVSPFAGLRYAKLSNTGYTEGSDISSPLTFAKTSQSASSAIAGVNLYDKPEGTIGLSLSAGVERYLSTSAAQLSATGLDGLSAVQVSPQISKHRPFASAQLRVDLAKNQQLLFGLSHTKQFANSDWVSSATVRYVIGL